MKTVAIVLLVAVLAAGGIIGYGLFNTSLGIIGKNVQVHPASDLPGEFQALKNAVEQKSLLGTLLSKAPLGSAQEYTYYVYSLTLKNNGLVPAEMVEMQIAPLPQDVLFYGKNEEVIIQPGQTCDLQCVLLTRGDTHPVRDLHVTYYLWGHPHEVKYTYDQSY